MNDYWTEYDRRVRAVEAEGLTRSDAQSVVDAEDLAAGRVDERGVPFELQNDPPAHRPRRFESSFNTLQKVLVDGMDCLPGQLDLFDGGGAT